MKGFVKRTSVGILCLIIVFQIIQPNNNVNAEIFKSLGTSIMVYMYRLSSGGENLGIRCQLNGDTSYGCTAFLDGTHPYPYSTNPRNVAIETDYLLDVVTSEMSPGDGFHEPNALEAQAVAARSYVNYYGNNYPVEYDNSINFQAFIPYKFEQLNSSEFPNNSNDPCGSTNLNRDQKYICNATSSRNYIAQAASNPNNLAAKALFASDIFNQTVDGTIDKPYLKSVPDPISFTCHPSGYLMEQVIGLSQLGANRWARGNLCPKPDPLDTPWSVRWIDTSQILFHYYTSVHLRDEIGNRLSPANRWNPLTVNFSGNCQPIMYPGQSCTASFIIQNTGTTTWSSQYFLIYHGWEMFGTQSQLTSQSEVIAQSVAPGETMSANVTYMAPTSPNPGIPYSIRIEMAIWDDYYGNIGFSELEPGKPWPVYTVNVCVGGPCKTYIPFLKKD